MPPSTHCVKVITTRFSDDKGFYYLKFLEEIQPSDKFEDKYQKRMTLLLSQKAAKSAGVGAGREARGEGEEYSPQGVNVEAVLDRIKAKVTNMDAPMMINLAWLSGPSLYDALSVTTG